MEEEEEVTPSVETYNAKEALQDDDTSQQSVKDQVETLITKGPMKYEKVNGDLSSPEQAFEDEENADVVTSLVSTSDNKLSSCKESVDCENMEAVSCESRDVPDATVSEENSCLSPCNDVTSPSTSERLHSPMEVDHFYSNEENATANESSSADVTDAGVKEVTAKFENQEVTSTEKTSASEVSVSPDITSSEMNSKEVDSSDKVDEGDASAKLELTFSDDDEDEFVNKYSLENDIKGEKEESKDELDFEKTFPQSPASSVIEEQEDLSMSKDTESSDSSSGNDRGNLSYDKTLSPITIDSYSCVSDEKVVPVIKDTDSCDSKNLDDSDIPSKEPMSSPVIVATDDSIHDENVASMSKEMDSFDNKSNESCEDRENSGCNLTFNSDVDSTNCAQDEKSVFDRDTDSCDSNDNSSSEDNDNSERSSSSKIDSADSRTGEKIELVHRDTHSSDDTGRAISDDKEFASIENTVSINEDLREHNDMSESGDDACNDISLSVYKNIVSSVVEDVVSTVSREISDAIDDSTVAIDDSTVAMTPGSSKGPDSPSNDNQKSPAADDSFRNEEACAAMVSDEDEGEDEDDDDESGDGCELSPNLSRTEYAQYLGLQPTVKFKCCKCGDANFSSITYLKEHQKVCLSTSRSSTPDANSATLNASQTQMRIARKVYLCSTCGTYFENWNLYIHMREVHRRHVCLVCLAMFLPAEQLAIHMSSNHNMALETFGTADDFLKSHPTSCYLTCCTCERIFSEHDNFFNHNCVDKFCSRGCAMCGLQFAHTANCPHSDSAASTANVIDKSIPSTSEPGPSKQQDTEINPEITSGLDIKKSPVKSIIKKKVLKIKQDANKLPVPPSNNKQQKLKPTCLRIKLTPVSKIKPSHRKSLNISDAKPVSEQDSDLDETQKDNEMDLNDELSMLADEDSNPPFLQNGDKSPTPEHIESLQKPETIVEKQVSDEDVEMSESPQPDSVNEPPIENKEPDENMSIDESVDVKEKEDDVDLEMRDDDDLEDSNLSEAKVEPDKLLEECDDDDKDDWHIDEQSSQDEDEENIPPADLPVEEEEELLMAGEEAPLIELTLTESPDKLPIQSILKQAVHEACNYLSCVYCTHANRIAVNGKQLAIHLLSEHRYQLISDSERLPIEKFGDIVKERLSELEKAFFNCDTYDNMNKAAQSLFVKIYECFQCRYVTKVHKDLYLHNRKMHQKNSLVCIMCKTNFYSYSELLCHLCPGIYVVANQPLFRCCFCPLDNLPSAFRFMVHVRKVHQACDVCLDVCGDQQKLSNHVWKHKLLHFCYRCGIAYRNKPDITKHLFWKHGTESVLCKRCLHKKWPYVYHFCIPPTSFICEECNATFSRAVALKVHRRLHTNELLYPCELCADSFISRKLLARHDRTIHNPPPPEETPAVPEQVDEEPHSPIDVTTHTDDNKDKNESTENKASIENTPEDSEKKDEGEKKKVVDVYDLPPLNLSSESEDESDVEEDKKKTEKEKQTQEISLETETKSPSQTEIPHPEIPQESVWENFKDYQSANKSIETPSTSSDNTEASIALLESIMSDHDYFSRPVCSPKKDEEPRPPSVEVIEEQPAAPAAENAKSSFDHDYCFNKGDAEKEAEKDEETPKKKQKNAKKKHKTADSGSSSSDSDSSSSDSDSSSCSCGTNCSCSSSSSSSSGSSSSDSSDSDSSAASEKRPKKSKKKEKKHKQDKRGTPTVNGHGEGSAGEEPNIEDMAGPPVLLFHESDLDTNESETDEDFYDEHPKLLMPNRNLLLLSTAADSLLTPQQTPAPTPPPPEAVPDYNGFEQNDTLTPINNIPKQSKGKKRKRSMSTPKRLSKTSEDSPYVKRRVKAPRPSTYKANLPSPNIYANTTQYSESMYSPSNSDMRGGSGSETDVRLSKRKRVPKKFYGDSSDEEGSTPLTPVGSYMPVQLPPQPPPPLLPPPAPLPPPSSTPQSKPAKKRAKSTSSSVVTDSSPRSMTESDLKLQATLDYVAAGFDGRTAADENYMKRGTAAAVAPPPPPPVTTPKQPKLILHLSSNNITRRPVSSSSSNDSSSDESEEEVQQRPLASIQHPVMSYTAVRQNNTKLYCYCQCPYDEVSEMIACDGKHCAIEWFHFDCVGISIPPKGKWYCPDCRKRYNIAEPAPNPEYFYNPSTEYMMSSSHNYSGT